jgi:hypothetical protein
MNPFMSRSSFLQQSFYARKCEMLCYVRRVAADGASPVLIGIGAEVQRELHQMDVVLWRRVWRSIVESIDVALCAVLVLAALWLLRGLSREKPDEAIVMATLAGALFGGAAILLGNWIGRFNERLRAAEDLEHRKDRLKALITAELVNVAAGLIGADEILDAARGTLESTGGTLSPDLVSYLPRDMPFTFGLGVELCVFEQPVIDAIVTLRSNLAITRESMEEVSKREGGAWRLQIVQVLNGLRFTMDVTAQ